jgi:hypothetical protein
MAHACAVKAFQIRQCRRSTSAGPEEHRPLERSSRSSHSISIEERTSAKCSKGAAIFPIEKMSLG